MIDLMWEIFACLSDFLRVATRLSSSEVEMTMRLLAPKNSYVKIFTSEFLRQNLYVEIFTSKFLHNNSCIWIFTRQFIGTCYVDNSISARAHWIFGQFRVNSVIIIIFKKHQKILTFWKIFEHLGKEQIPKKWFVEPRLRLKSTVSHQIMGKQCYVVK